MNIETEQIFILNSAPSQTAASIKKLSDAEMPGSSQVNLEDVEDFSHVCRMCATITEFVIPIFAGEGLQNNLADKIHKHLPIRVCEADVLPRVVCYQCASTLLAWHELVKCCVQADEALRSRLPASRQEPKPPNIKSSSSIEEESQSKFTIPQNVRDPPKYPEPPRPAPSPAPPRLCAYCPSSDDPTTYQKHLIIAHSDLLFYCEESNKYINKKDLMLHMSLHAVQYTTSQDKRGRKRKGRKKKETDVNQNTRVTETIAHPTIQENNIKQDNESQTSTKKDNENQENEFSDHSDMEYGFGPLPESVFEAIEDSQDSRPLEENASHTPESERFSDESNKSIPRPYNLRNSAQTPIETEHNINSAETPMENNNLSDSGENPMEINHIRIKASPLLESNNIVENAPVPIEDSKTVNNRASETNNLNNTDTKKDNHRKIRTCPICSKVYTASSSYFYHLKYFHKGSRDHECGVCHKKFGTRASLTQHMAIHTGQYEFECKQCSKLFKSKASLYIHEQTHIGKKTWTCDLCHISFRWKTHLLRHITRHSAEKGHVCTTCGRGFSIRCDLLRHARTHDAGNFTCDKCDLKFAQLRYLKVHMTKKHFG